MEYFYEYTSLNIEKGLSLIDLHHKFNQIMKRCLNIC